MKKLAIIGGGAAGLAAAVCAVRSGACARSQADAGGMEVTVYETDERVGRSILATGNGRCNFSNAQVDAAVYRNAEYVREAFASLAAEMAGKGRQPSHVAVSADSKSAERAEFSVQTRGEKPMSGDETQVPGGASASADPVHAFFFDLGLVWREESQGRLYPLANKASSVLDVLRAAAADAGAREACGCRAVRVDAPQREGERFHLRFADGAVKHADAVIVAVGGAAGRLELPGVLACAEGRPVLGPLRTDTELVRQLNNIRVRCGVTLVGPDGTQKAHELGEVLFRDYGVSGIAVFNLSRFAEEGDRLLIDFLPQVPPDEAVGLLRARRRRLASAGRPCSGEAVLRGMLLPAVADVVLKQAGLRPNAPFGKADAPPLARVLKGLPLAVRGMGDARQCQVARGGFAVGGFDARTMEAHEVPGLYVAGEALDVDAPCGGYNLHWAWASGMLAGRAAALRLAGVDERGGGVRGCDASGCGSSGSGEDEASGRETEQGHSERGVGSLKGSVFAKGASRA